MKFTKSHAAMQHLVKLSAIVIIYAGFHLVNCRVMAQSFVHPGILHSHADLARMQQMVAEKQEPVYGGYKKFAESPYSQYTYQKQGPLTMVGRNPTVGQSVYDNDANAAHQNAVMWAITGDKRYADKAIEIINAWSSALTSITGRDAILMAGLGPFKMINAAEIIRYTNAGWRTADVLLTAKHFREVIYPVIKNYAPFANGNWDAAAIKTCMAIAVFCDDRAVFENALQYYVHGWGNGSIQNYIINETGQVQESGRDQAHTQLGIGMLAECCAIAWNQGLDLYSYDNNRLLKGFEYTAKYNLGNDDLPFSNWLDRTGKYQHTVISDKARNNLRAVYEQVYNHYVVTRGLDAPFITRAAAKIRPEGPGGPGTDHPGYGTLFFGGAGKLLPGKPAAVAGVVVIGKETYISLKWVPVINATSYSIQRALQPGGPFTTIAKGIGTNSFTYNNVSKGKLYYYNIIAENKFGQTRTDALPTPRAGLPRNWKQASIGKAGSGISYFTGKELSSEAGGMGAGDSADAFHYTYFSAAHGTILSVRVLPEPSSQFSVFGLMLRENISSNAPFIALQVFPGKTKQVEAPNWHTRFSQRSVAGGNAATQLTGDDIVAPAVTYGRITGYYWLKLQIEQNECTGFTSYNGIDWKETGRATMQAGKTYLLGIAVASGMPNTTNVRFDNIIINGKLIK